MTGRPKNTPPIHPQLAKTEGVSNKTWGVLTPLGGGVCITFWAVDEAMASAEREPIMGVRGRTWAKPSFCLRAKLSFGVKGQAVKPLIGGQEDKVHLS